MKIILNKSVDALGSAGDLVTVKDGYARNYLIPKGLATMATTKNISLIKKEIENQNRKDAKTRDNLEALTKQLNKLSLKFDLKAGDDGRLFGSLTSQMISDEIANKGYTVDKKEIDISEPIKNIGKYFVHVKLSADLEAKIKIKVLAQK